MDARRSRIAPGALLFLGAFLVYAAGSRGTITAIDLQIRYETAQQICLRRTIEPTAEQAAAHPECYPANAAGKHYSIHGIGQSIAMLPAVAASEIAARIIAPPERRAELAFLGGQLIFTTLLIPLIAACGVFWCYRVGLNLELAPRLAVATAITLGFGTYWWFYAKTPFHDLELATCLLGALAFLGAAEGRAGRLLIGSALLGWTLQYRQEALIIALPVWVIGLVHLARSRHLRPASFAAWTLPIVLSGLGALWHNHVRTGSILEDPCLASLYGPELWTDFPLANALPITFGLSKGVFWYSPALLLGLVLLLPVWPGKLRFGAAERAFAVPALLTFVFVASLRRSADDWAWGPRFLLPVLPFLVIGLASLVRERFRSASVAAIAAAGLVLACSAQAALSFDTHETEVLQTLRAHGVEDGTATRGEIGHPLDSPLVGRLRNLGVPIADAPGATIPWQDARISELRRPLAGNLWWLKLAGMPEGKEMRGLLLLLGPALGILGLVGLVGAFRRAEGSPAPEAESVEQRELPGWRTLLEDPAPGSGSARRPPPRRPPRPVGRPARRG